VGNLRMLRDHLVDKPGSLGERRRFRRWESLHAIFPGIESMSVIDLGGRVEAWLRAPLRPATVCIINLEPLPEDAPPWIHTEQADICNLPSRISSKSYDLVFSNSVIEHLGGHAQRLRFADTVHKLASRSSHTGYFRAFSSSHWLSAPNSPGAGHWLTHRRGAETKGCALR
jgi:hypothetical protein